VETELSWMSTGSILLIFLIWLGQYILCTDKERSFALYPFTSFKYLLKANVNLNLLLLSIVSQ